MSLKAALEEALHQCMEELRGTEDEESFPLFLVRDHITRCISLVDRRSAD